ncbi:hypothetical protein FH968_19120 [Buttiauxella sp. B2]|uniref:hypothetical protein n=1 Tax=Buttiauxella sp. B2 TaxID=2587812 RepID=UPI00111DAB20|nr:hypothetical protein [Buttiauxella sp. B2]TNV16819.1 hypothetical protein FH968_19120 [Buttiauxella sp. B2]
MKKILLFLLGLSNSCFAAEPIFALKVASWNQDYQVSIKTPSIMYDGSEVIISMFAPNAPFFSASTHLTSGNCDGVSTMEVQDILAIPRSFTSNGVDFDYVRAEGDLAQVVNMPDGRIGLVATTPSKYSCSYYNSYANIGQVVSGWYGSGKTFSAVYKIRKLPVSGEYNISLPVDSYFTRREKGSMWGNMGPLAGYQTTKEVSSKYEITAWCRVMNQSINLDHKTMTPDAVDGNTVSSDVRLECGGGGKGKAKLRLSTGTEKSTINLGHGVQSEVNLSETEIDVAQDASVDVTVSSKLIASKDITAGELNGSEVLTVEWL